MRAASTGGGCVKKAVLRPGARRARTDARASGRGAGKRSGAGAAGRAGVPPRTAPHPRSGFAGGARGAYEGGQPSYSGGCHDPGLRFRHAPDPRRRPARPRDGGAAGADLPDDGLCLSQCRPRRRPLQPAGGRLHLFAPDEPDRGRAGRAGRDARGRGRGGLLLVGACGADHGALSAHGAGLQRGGLDPALWRHRHPADPDDPPLRLVG